MCLRKVGYHVAEKWFATIPLQKEDLMCKFVVDTLFSNWACRYIHKTLVQSLCVRQTHCAHHCGNPSCFYQSRHVIPVINPSRELYRIVLNVYKKCPVEKL